jgi:glucan-binding YG repeat protein
LSKKLSVLFLGFVMMLSVLVPKATFADSMFDVTLTISGEEYIISNDFDFYDFDLDTFMDERGLQETDKIEKVSVITPDGVESVYFEFLALSILLPDKLIKVKDNKAEYVVSEVLGDLDSGSDGVSIMKLRELMFPVNNYAWITATVNYADGSDEQLDLLISSGEGVKIPATNSVELSGITLVTNKGEVALKKVASNQFALNIAGNNGSTEVDAIKFTSPTAKTLSFFSNKSSLHRDETDIKFVNGVAVMNVEKLKLSDLADIIEEDFDYLTTYQEMKDMVWSLNQDTFNSYVAAENGEESPFQVKVTTFGWVFENGNWYYYDDQGERLTGWIETDGEWRYLDLSKGGAVKTGWLEWKEDWYYLDPASKPIPGKMVTGFKRISGKTYYFKENGVMAKGLTKIGNDYFYFDTAKANEGALVTGWVKVDGKWYYFNKTTGAAEKGWEKISGVWYYFDDNGVMQTGWKKISNKWYYFTADGAMQSGWELVKSKWYYFNAGGEMQSGWIKLGTKWYFLDKVNGDMKIGWAKDGAKWYYLDNGGVMKTGWLKDGGKWYYLDNGGVMKTGWVKVGTKWYYFYNSGVMAANTTIDGYRLGSNGAWIQ